ncbi:MAG: FecR domain-containing protein [Bacteroidetes bacterium]|nr:FecR domain-containing protein [Bacteroidota bacterium]MCY4233105.1 FecR domain-containing protein [Bacteroidota bacterium]
MHSDHNSTLPDEILEHLEYSEIPDTLRVWELASSYYDDEPSSQPLASSGNDMWSLINKATQPRIIRMINFRNSLALAASIAILLSVGIFFSLQQPNSVVAPLGQQLTHELPDGSTVMLNSGSVIKYDDDFGSTSRELTLKEGEIFLTVEHDELPFTVESFDAVTEVLGTSFNVRSWPEELDAATNVSVKTGQVRLTPLRDSDLSVTLSAGESALISSKGEKPVVTQAPDSESDRFPWIDGGFKFSGEPLLNVLSEIERRYNIKITVDSPDLKSYSIGIFKQSPANAEEIIRDICTISELNCEYRAVPDGFVLTSR